MALSVAIYSPEAPPWELVQNRGRAGLPERTGTFGIDRAITLTVLGLRVEGKGHKTYAQ